MLTRTSDKVNEQKLLFLSRSGSGAKYLGQNIEFWTKGSEALVTWGVIDTHEFKCKLDAGNTGGI